VVENIGFLQPEKAVQSSGCTDAAGGMNLHGNSVVIHLEQTSEWPSKVPRLTSHREWGKNGAKKPDGVSECS